jgi:hypothetical protein
MADWWTGRVLDQLRNQPAHWSLDQAMAHPLCRPGSSSALLRARVASQLTTPPRSRQLVPGGLFAMGIPFIIRESPRWLITVGKRDEAIKNLCVRSEPLMRPFLFLC